MAACASTTAERSDQRVIDAVPASLTLVPSRKLGGFEFYEKVLKRSRYFLAPMVDQSELAWRILSRRYGAEVCYTPMIHARLFSETHNKTYFAEQWQTNATDRPLIAQFCANDPNFLLQAALRIQDQCDAVDLNLGCPQGIAQKGHYGSFLMEEWDLVARMVNNLHTHLDVPVTCKIRVFPEVERTVAYARMLEAAGCQLLTVHGRLREQRGHKTGLADWEKIRRVREAVRIPVVANGNILYPEDMEACIKQTGVVGVMSAEGNLYNPALFAGRYLPSYELAGEYMAICRETPTALAYIRAHLFKLFRPSLPLHTDLRDRLAKARTHEEMESMVQDLTTRLKAEADLAPPFDINLAPKDADGFYILPHWIAQPYIRPPFDPKTSTKKRPVPVPVPRPTVSTAVGPGPVTTATAAPPAFAEPMPSSLAVTPAAGPSSETLAVVDPATAATNSRKRQKMDANGVPALFNGTVPDSVVMPSPPALSASDAKAARRNKLKCRHCGNVKSVRCPHHRCKRCCREHDLRSSPVADTDITATDSDAICEIHRSKNPPAPLTTIPTTTATESP